MRQESDHGPLQVVADQRAIGEALAAALTVRGVQAAPGDWGAGPSGLGVQDRVGVISCAVDDGLGLADAQAFLRLSPQAWVVVTDPPADARWGALLAVGACEVVGTGRDLDELLSTLEHVRAGGAGRQDATLSLFRAWVATHPAEARTLACLGQMSTAARTALRRVVRAWPSQDVTPGALEADGAATAAAFAALGVHDELAAATRLRSLDASPIFARRRQHLSA